MYKTGDMARRLSNGHIEYIGRYDQQVKINGYRVELAEIESYLVRYKGISEALVLVRTDKAGRRNLYAYYTVKQPNDSGIEAADIRNFLAIRLPYYMIPIHYIQLDKIPITINGKTDYSALPEPVLGGPAVELRLPGNEVESIMISVWKDLLNLDILAITDNFFELGGDSIKAVQIASRLFEMRIVLQSKDILTYHTIEQISRHVKFFNGKNVPEQGIVEGEKGLTPIENWFFKKRFHNPGFYNQTILLRFNRKINIAFIEEAFQMLIAHHDGLRINYDPGKEALFYNNSFLKGKFVINIYETGNGNNTESQIVEICQKIKSSFNINQNLLIKAAVLREGEDAAYLLITAHHLLVDGISWRILLVDFYTVYTKLEKGETARLPLKTASLKEWEMELATYKQGCMEKADESYRKEVESIEFSMPCDFNTNDWKARNAVTTAGYLDKERTGFLIKEAYKTYNTEVPVLLNAALLMALNEWTGLGKFVIEHESHGRHLDNIDTSRTIGWFTAIYPVKLELLTDSIGDQIKSVKVQIKKIPAYGIGYSIHSDSFKGPNDNKEKLPEIRFNYLGQFDRELHNELFTFSHLSTGSDIDPENNMTVNIELNLMVIEGALKLEIIYNNKAYKISTITRFKELFFLHLNHILDHIKREEDIHFTPSDFESVNLDQEELDSLFK